MTTIIYIVHTTISGLVSIVYTRMVTAVFSAVPSATTQYLWLEMITFNLA